MSRLPQPGQDKGTWGTILNDFLTTSHNPDGTLKAQADITDAKTKADSAVQSVNGKTGTTVTLAAADVSAEPAGLSDDTKTSLDTTYAHYENGELVIDGIPVGALSSPSTPGFVGVNKQAFVLADLTSPTGLTVTNGKLAATASGTAGTATIPLPVTLDKSQPFRWYTIFEVNDITDDQNVEVRLGLPSNVNRGVTARVRGGTNNSSSTYANAYISRGAGAQIARANGGTLTAGQYVCAVISDGTTYSVECRHLTIRSGGPGTWINNGGGGYAMGVGGTTEAVATGNVQTDTIYDNVTPVWSGVTHLAISTSSTVNFIVATWVELGDVIAPSGDTTSHFFHRPLVSSGTIANIGYSITGRGYDGRRSRPVVLALHPNASDEMVNSSSATLAGPMLEALRDAGFIVVFVQGDKSAALTDPVNSAWGAPVGRPPIDAAVQEALAMFPASTPIHLWGSSMGLVNALMLHRTQRGRFASIIGFSGVASLEAAYTGAGTTGTNFKTQIDAAWGTSTQAAIAPFSPAENPSFYTGIPIRLWHGDADNTIAKTTHADAFAAAVNALDGGNVTVTNVAGGGHLDTAMYAGIDPSEVAGFFLGNS